MLPDLIKGLKDEELLKCRIVAAGGGWMPSWEVQTRLQVERNKKKDAEEKKSLEGGRVKKGPSRGQRDEYEEGYDDDDDDYSWHHGSRTTACDLILFKRELYPLGRGADPGFYLMMPNEARQHFRESGSLLDVKLLPLVSGTPEIDKQFAEPADLFGLIQALLDGIAEKRPKPTPKEGLVPKSVMLPLFEKFVARSEVYREDDNAQSFGWEDVDETVMGFLYAAKLVRRRGEVLEVVPERASGLLSSTKELAGEFFGWWGSNNNTTSVIKSKIYEFEVKIRGVKSDEVKARSVLSKQIQEMEPGKIYSVRSIVERCKLEGGARLFENEHGVNVWGPGGIVEDLFPEFLALMMTYPLAVLGVLEMSKNGRLVRLGRWRTTMTAAAVAPSSPVAQRQSSIEPAAPTSGRGSAAILVTPDFQLILQPSLRNLSFQLREFCESLESPGPALIFKLTKGSFLNALRRDALTAQKAIEFLSASAASVPDNIVHELKEWERRYGEVEIKTAEVVRCRDETIAEMLMNDPEARRCIIGRMGKDALEIAPGSRTKLLSRCDRLGLFAKG